jgi:small subunit ribosomal protein S20
MAWHQSPKKRLRRDVKKQAANKSQMSRLRTMTKKARASIVPQMQDMTCLRNAQAELAKAGSKGLIHRKNAARKISRLMKQAHKNTLAASA